MQSIRLLGFIIMLLSGSAFPYEVKVHQSEGSNTVPAKNLLLKKNEGVVYHCSEPFSGISISYYQNGMIAETIEYKDGKRNGDRSKWFPDGQISFRAYYKDNILHGTTRTWWRNGQLRSEYQYLEGQAHGLQREWYGSGDKFKERQLVDGKEAGLQRAWRKNGKLYVNYEAKAGRIFGLKRASLCLELTSEKISSQQEVN